MLLKLINFFSILFFSTCVFSNITKTESHSKVGICLGEKLEYVVRWGIFPVGHASLHVKDKVVINGRQTYYIVAEAKSNSFLSKFYPVKDKVETWIDVQTFVPLKYRKSLNEGGYHADEQMIYDHELKKAYYKSLKNNTEKEMEIPVKCQDALSCLYFFRSLDLDLNKEYEINVNSDEKNWILRVAVLKQVPSKDIRSMGSFPAILVEPKAKYQGLFVKKGRVKVWLTDDKRKIPILMSSKIPFGSVSASIKSIHLEK